MLYNKLKEMFNEMVIKKNAALIPQYYHPEFVLTTNGQTTNYQEFIDSHHDYYDSPKQYSVKYDEETFFEATDKITGRMWITVSVPGELPKELEVILIAQYKQGLIYRLWELTYPDWSQLPEFNN